MNTRVWWVASAIGWPWAVAGLVVNAWGHDTARTALGVLGVFGLTMALVTGFSAMRR